MSDVCVRHTVTGVCVGETYRQTDSDRYVCG